MSALDEKRYAVKHDRYSSPDEWCEEVYDTVTGEQVGTDGGEPEDQTLCRDWRWVVDALNNAYALGAADAKREAIFAHVADLEVKQRAAYAKGAADRQARIVAWLRSCPSEGQDDLSEPHDLRSAADAIEVGACVEGAPERDSLHVLVGELVDWLVMFRHAPNNSENVVEEIGALIDRAKAAIESGACAAEDFATFAKSLPDPGVSVMAVPGAAEEGEDG